MELGALSETYHSKFWMQTWESEDQGLVKNKKVAIMMTFSGKTISTKICAAKLLDLASEAVQENLEPQSES